MKLTKFTVAIGASISPADDIAGAAKLTKFTVAIGASVACRRQRRGSEVDEVYGCHPTVHFPCDARHEFVAKAAAAERDDPFPGEMECAAGVAVAEATGGRKVDPSRLRRLGDADILGQGYKKGAAAIGRPAFVARRWPHAGLDGGIERAGQADRQR